MLFCTNEEIAAFANRYVPASLETVRRHKGDNRVFTQSEGETVGILTEILTDNPHLRLKHETAADYITIARNSIPGWARCTYGTAEALILYGIEEYNSNRWTFRRGVRHCPYWQMDRDELAVMAREMEEIVLAEINKYKK